MKYIQVWKYEGKSLMEAKAAIVDIHRLFASRFGGARVDGISGGGPDGLTGEALNAVLASVLDHTRALGADFRVKHNCFMTALFDMMPLRQPFGSRLQSRWGYSGKHDTFYVLLFQDRPDGPPRTVKSGIEMDCA